MCVYYRFPPIYKTCITYTQTRNLPLPYLLEIGRPFPVLVHTINGSEKSHFRNCVYHSFFSFSGSGACSVMNREREKRAPSKI